MDHKLLGPSLKPFSVNIQPLMKICIHLNAAQTDLNEIVLNLKQLTGGQIVSLIFPSLRIGCHTLI